MLEQNEFALTIVGNIVVALIEKGAIGSSDKPAADVAQAFKTIYKAVHKPTD